VQRVTTDGLSKLPGSWSFWTSAVLFSIVFAAAHLANSGEKKFGIIMVFIDGMSMCFSLWRTGDLWFAIGNHAAWDWGETFLFGTPNSGLHGQNALMNPAFHGPTLLAGGTDGPEGSVLVLLSEALIVVLVAIIYRQPKFPLITGADVKWSMYWWFKSKPHRFYGACYLLAIPLFASLYCVRSGDFYEPNLVAEAELVDLRGRIEQRLCEPIRKFYDYSQKPGFTRLESIPQVADLACDGSRMTFTTPLRSEPGTKSFSISSFRPFWTVELPAIEEPNVSFRRRVHLEVKNLPLFVVLALIKNHEIHPGEHYAWGPVRHANFEPDVDSGVPPGLLTGLLEVEPDLYRDIEEYSSACHGLPRKVTGGFPRFLYLSAVTITTLGYGDIIPVNNLARTLVALEAVIGIVLAGLFVSSVWQNRGKPDKSRSVPKTPSPSSL
jgi:hypothetical protein